MTKSDIAIMFRWPRFPAIVLSTRGLDGALDRKQLIDLYNPRRAPGQEPYAPGSTSNSRLERIVADLARILRGADDAPLATKATDRWAREDAFIPSSCQEC